MINSIMGFFAGRGIWPRSVICAPSQFMSGQVANLGNVIFCIGHRVFFIFDFRDLLKWLGFGVDRLFIRICAVAHRCCGNPATWKRSLTLWVLPNTQNSSWGTLGVFSFCPGRFVVSCIY